MYFYVTLLSHYGIRSDRIYLSPPRLNTCVVDSRDVPEKFLYPRDIITYFGVSPLLSERSKNIVFL